MQSSADVPGPGPEGAPRGSVVPARGAGEHPADPAHPADSSAIAGGARVHGGGGAETRRGSVRDGPRFAFGTLSVVPVTVTRWDRSAARSGMLWAPVVGAVLGLCAAVVGGGLVLLGAGAPLGAVASVAAWAVLTRGLHLDGLADTADGLGSGKPAADALRIMKRSDIGPFGVVTLVLVLLGQVAALAALYADSWARGATAAAVSAAAARLALTLAAREGVPSARPDGLGAAVAGTVPRGGALLVAAATVTAAAGVGLLSGVPDGLRCGLAVLAACAAAGLLRRHCVRRLGGVTGDVFGALAETAASVALVVLCLGG